MSGQSSSDPEVGRGDDLEERDGVLHRLDQRLPERQRHGHERAREEVHGIGEGDLGRSEQDVADLSIRERLDDESHGFTGFLPPAREVQRGEFIEQWLEHRSDLFRHADPEPAHLHASQRELVADVIEKRGVLCQNLSLGANLRRGLAEAVRAEEREQVRATAPENLHRRSRFLGRVLDRVDGGAERAELLRGRLPLQLFEINAELLDRVVCRAALERLRHLAEHRPDVLRRFAGIRELLLQDNEIAHGHAGIRREVVELPADIERLLEMIEPRHHNARRRADSDEGRGEFGDARLQREHLAIDARQRAAQAAVVGIESGGGFRHDHRAASTHSRAQ
jgi:hypothetical protein